MWENGSSSLSSLNIQDVINFFFFFFFFFLVDTFRALEVDSRANAPGYRIEPGLDFEDGRYYEERLVSESDVEEVCAYNNIFITHC